MIFVTHQYHALQMMDNCAIGAPAQMSFIRGNGHVCPESGMNLAVLTHVQNIIGGFKS